MIPPPLPQSLKTTPRLDRWVCFNADRTVTVFSGKVELGQGIETAIAQIAADELDVTLERLSLVAGDTTQSPDEWYTAGSQSIEIGGMAMRLACAEVRSLFLDAAARELEVNAAELRVRDGTISMALSARARQGATFAPRSPGRHMCTTSSFRAWYSAACCGRRRIRRDSRRLMPARSARCRAWLR